MAQRIAFLQSSWHDDLVGRIQSGFIDEYAQLGGKRDDIDIITVPGALEFPLHAQILAKSGKYDAIVCAGLIVDGGIYSHQYVAATVLDAMMRVQLETEVPVLSAVLTPQHFAEQGEEYDFLYEHLLLKGQEAAGATVKTIESLAAIR